VSSIALDWPPVVQPTPWGRARAYVRMIPPKEKRCSKCGETKPASAFPLAHGNRDGFGGVCRLCVSHASYDACKAQAKAQKGEGVSEHVFMRMFITLGVNRTS
jgi:hypothetical protein